MYVCGVCVGIDDDTLRDVLAQCGSVASATEFLQEQSDEAEAERVLYNTMELNPQHRPAPPLPKGALPGLFFDLIWFDLIWFDLIWFNLI